MNRGEVHVSVSCFDQVKNDCEQPHWIFNQYTSGFVVQIENVAAINYGGKSLPSTLLPFQECWVTDLDALLLCDSSQRVGLLF